MKGVPIRIDLGLNEIKKNQLTVFRRDLDKKEIINEKDLTKYIEKVSKESGKNLIKKADKIFDSKIKQTKNIEEIKKVIQEGAIARCDFCSIDKEGTPCAEIIEKKAEAKVRGIKLTNEKPKGKCVICGKKATKVVYVARDY